MPFLIVVSDISVFCESNYNPTAMTSSKEPPQAVYKDPMSDNLTKSVTTKVRAWSWWHHEGSTPRASWCLYSCCSGRNAMLYIAPPPNPLLHAPRRWNNKWTPFPKYQETFNMMLMSACKPRHTAEHSLKTDKFVGEYRWTVKLKKNGVKQKCTLLN